MHWETTFQTLIGIAGYSRVYEIYFALIGIKLWTLDKLDLGLTFIVLHNSIL